MMEVMEVAEIVALVLMAACVVGGCYYGTVRYMQMTSGGREARRQAERFEKIARRYGGTRAVGKDGEA